MNETLKTIVAIVAILVVLPVSILLIRDWFNKPSQKDIEAYSRKFRTRFQNPDFLALEKHFGCTLPTYLKELYNDSKEVMRSDFEIASSSDAPEKDKYFISWYQPADNESVQNVWPRTGKYFAFADDGSGNGYLIDPRKDDPSVFFHDHETGDMERICGTF